MNIHRIWTILAVLVIGSSLALAQIPREITVQGQLFQENGEPLPDGEYLLNIRLYDDPTAGKLVAELCAPCSITMSNGVFSVVLGGEGQSPLPPMDRQYWLEFARAGRLPLLPRLALTAVPYALNAAATPSQPPVGTIVAFAGKKGYDAWMVCNGTALSSAEYPELFAVIDSTWGNGSNDEDPATDFNVPDLRGVFLRGDDQGVQRDQNVHARLPASDVPSIGDVDRDGYPEVVVGRYQGLPETGDTKMSAPPNAAVLYLIRVR